MMYLRAIEGAAFIQTTECQDATIAHYCIIRWKLFLDWILSLSDGDLIVAPTRTTRIRYLRETAESAGQASWRRTIVVPDVHKFPDILCIPNQSEIVVPSVIDWIKFMCHGRGQWNHRDFDETDAPLKKLPRFIYEIIYPNSLKVL